jgi:hypothetical protein
VCDSPNPMLDGAPASAAESCAIGEPHRSPMRSSCAAQIPAIDARWAVALPLARTSEAVRARRPLASGDGARRRTAARSAWSQQGNGERQIDVSSKVALRAASFRSRAARRAARAVTFACRRAWSRAMGVDGKGLRLKAAAAAHFMSTLPWPSPSAAGQGARRTSGAPRRRTAHASPTHAARPRPRTKCCCARASPTRPTPRPSRRASACMARLRTADRRRRARAREREFHRQAQLRARSRGASPPCLGAGRTGLNLTVGWGNASW